MEEVERLYYATLAKESMEELPVGYNKSKFMELCKRAIDQNPDLEFEDKINVSLFYLRTFLRHPHDNL